MATHLKRGATAEENETVANKVRDIVTDILSRIGKKVTLRYGIILRRSTSTLPRVFVYQMQRFRHASTR